MALLSTWHESIAISSIIAAAHVRIWKDKNQSLNNVYGCHEPHKLTKDDVY